MPHHTGTREADLGMWCMGTASSQGGEESQAICKGKKTNPEDPMGCPLLSHKAGTPTHLCFGW